MRGPGFSCQSQYQKTCHTKINTSAKISKKKKKTTKYLLLSRQIISGVSAAVMQSLHSLQDSCSATPTQKQIQVLLVKISRFHAEWWAPTLAKPPVFFMLNWLCITLRRKFSLKIKNLSFLICHQPGDQIYALV